jgi:hypothetical protein
MKSASNHTVAFKDLLVDTWWFGLSNRLDEQAFLDLAMLRVQQSFSAVQLVVGVPPEVGPANENAASTAGFPWTLDGSFNPAYLDLARHRIQYLNNRGLKVIVYGAWGHQIEWLGQAKMLAWWRQIIQVLDDLDVIYCLCGESDLWAGEAAQLLPDKTTSDLTGNKARLARLAHRFRFPRGKQLAERRAAWSNILEHVSQATEKPVLIHPVPGVTGHEAVHNPQCLSANTLQTGHQTNTRNHLWQLPLAHATVNQENRDNSPIINLEPWYEGIKDKFWAQDQLYAYWVSQLAGASGYCYGAHGIWNVGDGQFLAHWGKQTFGQARALDTPRLIGLSHHQYMRHRPYGATGRTFYETKDAKLRTIGKKTDKQLIQFFPDVAQARHIPEGRNWLPLEGSFSDTPPLRGSVVVLADLQQPVKAGIQ